MVETMKTKTKNLMFELLENDCRFNGVSFSKRGRSGRWMINFFVLFIGIIIGYAIATICIISSMESKKEEKIDSSLYRDKEWYNDEI